MSKFMAFLGVILYRIQSLLSLQTDFNFRHLFSCNTMGYTVVWNECIIISCVLCPGDSFYGTSLTPLLWREQLMIFKSPRDARSHGDSSEILEIFAGKFPLLFCVFDVIFIIIVEKPNTFLKICCTTLWENYFCIWKKLHYIYNKKIYVGHANSWYLLK